MIRLTDVTLRDGLQSEGKILSTPQKVELYHCLSSIGYHRLEVTSFVRPDRIPPLADAEVFLSEILKSKPSSELMAFVPNTKGLERFLKFSIPWASAFIAASETFNQKNIGRSIDDTLTELGALVAATRGAGRKLRIYVSTVFGCPYEGEPKEEALFNLLDRVQALGPDEIALSDTIGVALPERVREVIRHLRKNYPAEKMALHLHNTYGLALMNLEAGYEEGIRSFDGSTGGIGGCPYAKGASGNMASEGIFYAFGRKHQTPTIQWDAVRTSVKWLIAHGLGVESSIAKVIDKGGTLYGIK